MIHIAQAIIVEGKYDKIKLSSILDAVILVIKRFSHLPRCRKDVSDPLLRQNHRGNHLDRFGHCWL